ncbi:MAG: hypothetical protein ABIR70_13560 [Bryobacteraceae bacterium]
MITPTRGLSLDSLAAVSNQSGLNRATLSQTGTSFAQQLAESLEGYLNQASAGSHLEIDVLPSQGGNSGTRQFLVTVKGPQDTALTTPTPATAPATSVTAGPTDNGPFTNEVDAYWASQPKEVQVLRTIRDWDERGQMGQKLAQQGFAIDPNIMIHGWDPYMTMKIRQGEGYTWIPAVGQDGIPVSPGLNFPGLPSYDPSKPPPGSIQVTTDFAIGLEHTSPGAGNVNFGNAVQS